MKSNIQQLNNDILTAKQCPYCFSGTKLIDSAEIYGKSFGLIWACLNFPKCNAYVGCHGNGKGKTPLGRLADRQLRQWKKNAHAVFDSFRHKKGMSRGGAYRWLSEQMGIEPSKTHIGMFDVEQCKQVVRLVKEAS